MYIFVFHFLLCLSVYMFLCIFVESQKNCAFIELTRYYDFKENVVIDGG